MTSVSSAFPRSERVYPAIMPLGAISSGDPSWRKASRYVRIGRDDLHVVRTTAIIVASPLAEAFHFNGRGTTSASSVHHQSQSHKPLNLATQMAETISLISSASEIRYTGHQSDWSVPHE